MVAFSDEGFSKKVFFCCNLPIARRDLLSWPHDLCRHFAFRFYVHPSYMTHDETLLIGLKAKKPEAFERLIDLYEGQLFRFFYCDHRNFHVAEEQLAETLLEFTRSVHQMRGTVEQLPGFIFGIARNVRLRYWRRKGTDRATQQERGEAELVVDSKISAASHLEARDQIELVLGIIGQFENPVRDALSFDSSKDTVSNRFQDCLTCR